MLYCIMGLSFSLASKVRQNVQLSNTTSVANKGRQGQRGEFNADFLRKRRGAIPRAMLTFQSPAASFDTQQLPRSELLHKFLFAQVEKACPKVMSLAIPPLLRANHQSSEDFIILAI